MAIGLFITITIIGITLIFVGFLVYRVMSEKPHKLVLHFQESRYVDLDSYPIRLNQNIDSKDHSRTWQLIGQYCGTVKGLLNANQTLLPIHSRYWLPVSPWKDLLSNDELERLTNKDDIKCNAFDNSRTANEASRTILGQKNKLLWILGFEVFVYGILVLMKAYFK